MDNASNHIYRIQPKDNVKFVQFGRNKVTIDDNDYVFSNFINSGKFKIHDVIVFGGATESDLLYHVWYESK